MPYSSCSANFLGVEDEKIKATDVNNSIILWSIQYFGTLSLYSKGEVIRVLN
jgi:hypothetical protein